MDVYITASSATDIYYLVRKYLHSTEQAKQVMGKLFSLMGILTVTEDECVDAFASAVSDYEDAVIERTAVKVEYTQLLMEQFKKIKEERPNKDYERGHYWHFI